jgi:hypothetical protein
VNIGGAFDAAGDLKIAAARCAGADEDCVVIFRQQRLHAVNALAADEFDTEVEDVVGLFVNHRFWQPEFRDLRAHHAAGFRILIEDRAVVSKRGRGRARP